MDGQITQHGPARVPVTDSARVTPQKGLEDKLRAAARDGNTGEVVNLLDAGVGVDAAVEHGWTSLMWASMYGRIECVNTLLDRGAQPNLQDKDGRTPLMCASSTGQMDCVDILLQRGAQLCLKDKDGWTALRYASSRGKADCVKLLLQRGALTDLSDNTELVEAAKNGEIDEVMRLAQLEDDKVTTPEGKLRNAAERGRTEQVHELLNDGVHTDAMNEVGESPLILAAGFGHTECVNLLLSRGAKVNHQDKIGHTALHWASLYGHTATVRALLAVPGIDVNQQGIDGLIPLKVATKYDIITMFQKYNTNCEDYPIHSFGKVILCGDTGSGKTTLAEAIKYCSQTSFNKEKHNPPHVKPLTAGIIPHVIKNTETTMTLFDLAGHHTYYSSHCAILEALSLTPSTFLLLVKLPQLFEEINAQLYYWYGMIGDVCHNCPQNSSVIVVCTHADMISSKDRLDTYCREIEKSAKIAFKKHTFSGLIALNATAFNGEEMQSFMSLLRQTNRSVVAKYPAISLNSHMMYAFLNDKVGPHEDAVPLSKLLDLLKKEEPKFLPTETPDVSPLLRTLSEKGLIVYLEGEPAKSWIVIHPAVLLEEVNGVLFAPQHLPIASNTGVIPVILLKQYFPKYDINMIVHFLQLFELCVHVTLENMDTNMGTHPDVSATDPGLLLFFPACVNVARPPSVTILSKVFSWQICTASIDQSFSPRCLHVLDCRLANFYALRHVHPPQVPQLNEYNRRCDVWCKGISWRAKTGAQIVVEMKDDFRCLLCTVASPIRISPKYLHSLITFIKQVCNQFCPSVELLELIECPAEVTSDNTKTTVELSCLKEIIHSKGETLIDSTGNKEVALKKWVEQEPMLYDLFGVDGNEDDAPPPKHPRLDHNEDCSHSSPKLADLLNDVAFRIPTKWRDVGINLGLSSDTLDGIQNQFAGRTDSNMRSFERVFSIWGKDTPYPYTWETIIHVLNTSTVKEHILAKKMASKYMNIN